MAGSLVQWLMDHGGPVVRWRAAMELAPGPAAYDLEVLRRDLLSSPAVQLWLGRLRPSADPNALHHSKPEAFENACHKLCELGLRAGMAPLDERVAPLRAWLAEAQARDAGWRAFYRVLVAAALARAGYQDEAIAATLQTKLDWMHRLAATGRHDIYISADTYGDVPAGRRAVPLVDPALYANGVEQLPSIHALYGLAYAPRALDTPANRGKIAAVLDYILHPAYQAVYDGYGLMRVGPRRYYSIGWDAKLPGWEGFPPTKHLARATLQRIELMSRFPRIHAHPWFQAALAHLETFCTPSGTYALPSVYLSELDTGYYVSGARMGLDAGRRDAALREVEGTLRRALIHKAIVPA